MNQVSGEIFREKICKFHNESQDAANFGALSISNKFGTQAGCSGKKLVYDVGNARIINCPVANAMQCAFAARIVWNLQQPFQDDKNLRIKSRSLGQIWATMNRQNVPPHVANAVKGVRSTFVNV